MFNELKITEISKKYWKPFLSILLLASCVLVWSERVYRSHKLASKIDFTEIESLLSSYDNGTPLSVEQVVKVNKILKKHPELAPSYDITLAEAFILQQDGQIGVAIAEKHFDQVYKNLPLHYQEYCRSSFEITEEKWEAAYLRSLQVEALCLKEAPDSFLRGLNFLRICSLANKLNKEVPWQELMHLSSFKQLNGACIEGDLSLESYLRFKEESH